MANLKIRYRPLAELKAYARNSRTHSEAQIAQIAASIEAFGWTNPILIDEAGQIIAGHGRLLAAAKLGMTQVPTIELAGLSEAQRRALVIADNKLALNAGWNDELLGLELADLEAGGFDLALIGFDADELADLGIGDAAGAGGGGAPGSLSERFMVAPFSVLNAREGWWQDRKKAWLALGIQSECGRGENLLKMSETCLEPDPKKRAAAKKAKRVEATENVVAGNGWGNGGPARRDPSFYAKKRKWEADNGKKISTTEFREKYWDGAKEASGGGRHVKGGLAFGEMNIPPGAGGAPSGTSIFDPVLCELAYRWFSPVGGLILDPFAGGSVRGIVDVSECLKEAEAAAEQAQA